MTPAEATEALDGIAKTLRLGADGQIELDPRMLWMLHAAMLRCIEALNEIDLAILDDPSRNIASPSPMPREGAQSLSCEDIH